MPCDAQRWILPSVMGLPHVSENRRQGPEPETQRRGPAPVTKGTSVSSTATSISLTEDNPVASDGFPRVWIQL